MSRTKKSEKPSNHNRNAPCVSSNHCKRCTTKSALIIILHSNSIQSQCHDGNRSSIPPLIILTEREPNNLVAPAVIPRSPQNWAKSCGNRTLCWRLRCQCNYNTFGRSAAIDMTQGCMPRSVSNMHIISCPNFFGAVCLFCQERMGKSDFSDRTQNKRNSWSANINKKSFCVDHVNKHERYASIALAAHFLFDVYTYTAESQLDGEFFSLHCANLLLVLCIVKIIISFFCLSCALNTLVFMAVKRRQLSIKMTSVAPPSTAQSLNFIYGPFV